MEGLKNVRCSDKVVLGTIWEPDKIATDVPDQEVRRVG